MERPTYTMPDWMTEQIDARRSKNENCSKYVRRAVMARFLAEDADEWEAPEIQPDRIHLKEVPEP